MMRNPASACACACAEDDKGGAETNRSGRVYAMMRNPASARACACAEDNKGGAEKAVVDELETWEYIEDVDACLEWPSGVEKSLYGFETGPLGMLLTVVCVGLGWRSVSVGERAWPVELLILEFPFPWFGRGW